MIKKCYICGKNTLKIYTHNSLTLLKCNNCGVKKLFKI